jgi:hypothetical protein
MTCHTYPSLYHLAFHITKKIHGLIKFLEVQSHGSRGNPKLQTLTPFPHVFCPANALSCLWKQQDLIVPQHFFSQTIGCIWCDVSLEVLSIWQGTKSVESINEKLLVLISKFKNLTLISQFWPISLCNVFYKIASKVLANHIKLMHPNGKKKHLGKVDFPDYMFIG